MGYVTKFAGRAGAVAAALLLMVVVPGCVDVAAPTAPDIGSVATRPATQSPRAARFDFASAVGAGSAISSDGVSGEYRDAVCGVTARVFFLDPDYLDGNLQLDNSRALDRKCVTFGAAAYPRKLTVRYPDTGVTQVNTGGVNVADMGTVQSGTPGLRSMGVRIAGTGARCASLSFGGAQGGSQVLVTRVSASSWSVESPVGGATAACTAANGSTSTIGGFVFAFSVTLN